MGRRPTLSSLRPATSHVCLPTRHSGARRNRMHAAQNRKHSTTRYFGYLGTRRGCKRRRAASAWLRLRLALSKRPHAAQAGATPSSHLSASRSTRHHTLPARPCADIPGTPNTPSPRILARRSSHRAPIQAVRVLTRTSTPPSAAIRACSRGHLRGYLSVTHRGLTQAPAQRLRSRRSSIQLHCHLIIGRLVTVATHRHAIGTPPL